MSKRLSNPDLAELLRDVAASYKLKNEAQNRFRIVAYEKAADAIEHATSDAYDLWEEDKLDDIPGLGESMISSISELFKEGKSEHFEKIMDGIPKSVFVLMKVPKIGPKTAFALVKEFKIDKNPIETLIEIAERGKIRNLEGFGEKSESDILRSLKEYKTKAPKRHLMSEAFDISQSLVDWMRQNKETKSVEGLGSLRRRVSTIGDIDIAVATNDSVITLSHFCEFPKAVRVIEKGDISASILLPGNIQADCMALKPQAFGSLLQHFTGSKHHNVALREYSLKKGLSLSEKGIKDIKTGKMHEFDSEEKFYKYLGLSFIPPELREDAGEIEKALNGDLPKLVELKDIKGDLHMHSDFDVETSHDLGVDSMKDMIESANKLNYEYISFSEHNPSQSKHTKDQINIILKRKREFIDQLNTSLVKSVKGSVKKVFNSLEIDIKPDGSLPIDEKGLNYLDFALVSVHSSFELNKFKMTQRILKAFENPKVKVFAHPTARLLDKRNSIDLDWQKIFQACIDRNIYLEINADPHRLDLPDLLVRDAIRAGVKLTLGTDSHQKEGFLNMKYGVFVARRGWAKREDIINTYSLGDFENLMGVV